jgi:AcrR family transcriptional regulator
MVERVNPKRRYDSPRRREQAAATRLHILQAAQRLFEQQGYAATTMAAIATEGGVALKTVYLAFETKSGVVQALWDVLLRGPVDRPVAAQPWYREVIEERDPERRLWLNARNSREVKTRIGALLQVIRSAAPLDGDIAVLWDDIQADFYDNQRVIVQQLHHIQALRPDLDVTRATDILWTFNHPDVWQLLVGMRGWTPEQYEQWFGDTACAQLLRPDTRHQGDSQQ